MCQQKTNNLIHDSLKFDGTLQVCTVYMHMYIENNQILQQWPQVRQNRDLRKHFYSFHFIHIEDSVDFTNGFQCELQIGLQTRSSSVFVTQTPNRKNFGTVHFSEAV